MSLAFFLVGISGLVAYYLDARSVFFIAGALALPSYLYAVFYAIRSDGPGRWFVRLLHLVIPIALFLLTGSFIETFFLVPLVLVTSNVWLVPLLLLYPTRSHPPLRRTP